MREDRYGLALSTASDAARDHYVVAQDALLSGTGDPVAAADAAIAIDPGFALAHAARARGLQLAARFPESIEAADCALALAVDARPWEQAHAAITVDLMRGKVDDAFDRLRLHVADCPCDALSLSAAAGVFGLIGFSGRPGREAEQVAFLEPFRRHYDGDWWFDTAFAFALCENDAAMDAIPLIERALEANPRSAHGAHTYMHVLIEAGAAQPGPGWLSDWLPGYANTELMHCHLWWHLGLFQLHAGDFDAMWASFREHCLPGRSTSPPINVFTDGVAMLWRAGLAGAAPDASAWQDVRALGDQWFARPGIFVDVHKAVCLAALHEFEALHEYAASLRAAHEAGKVRAGNVVPELAIAFGECARGEWRACTDRIDAVAGDVVRIGGSRAQRRIISETRDFARARAG